MKLTPMPLISIAFLLFILSGCWSGETVYREKEVVFTPDAVKDSIAQAIRIRSSKECDSLVQRAVDEVGNFMVDQVNAEGDYWQLTVQSVRDSAKQALDDSLSHVLRYHRTAKIDVKPHTDSVAVLFPVKEMRPWKFWEQLKLAIAWPLLFLFLISALVNFIFIRKDITKSLLKNASKMIG